MIELREDVLKSKVCFNAETGEEIEEIIQKIEKTEAIPSEYKAPKIRKDWAINEFYRKKIEGFENEIKKQAEGIIERTFQITKMILVLVPWYRITFQYKGETKSWLICAIDGAMKKQG